MVIWQFEVLEMFNIHASSCSWPVETADHSMNRSENKTTSCMVDTGSDEAKVNLEHTERQCIAITATKTRASLFSEEYACVVSYQRHIAGLYTKLNIAFHILWKNMLFSVFCFYDSGRDRGYQYCQQHWSWSRIWTRVVVITELRGRQGESDACRHTSSLYISGRLRYGQLHAASLCSWIWVVHLCNPIGSMRCTV